LKEVRLEERLAGPAKPSSPVEQWNGARRYRYRIWGCNTVSGPHLVGLGEPKTAIVSASIVVTALGTRGFQISHSEKFGGRTVVETLPSAQPNFQRRAGQL